MMHFVLQGNCKEPGFLGGAEQTKEASLNSNNCNNNRSTARNYTNSQLYSASSPLIIINNNPLYNNNYYNFVAARAHEGIDHHSVPLIRSRSFNNNIASTAHLHHHRPASAEKNISAAGQASFASIFDTSLKMQKTGNDDKSIKKSKDDLGPLDGHTPSSYAQHQRNTLDDIDEDGDEPGIQLPSALLQSELDIADVAEMVRVFRRSSVISLHSTPDTDPPLSNNDASSSSSTSAQASLSPSISTGPVASGSLHSSSASSPSPAHVSSGRLGHHPSVDWSVHREAAASSLSLHSSGERTSLLGVRRASWLAQAVPFLHRARSSQAVFSAEEPLHDCNDQSVNLGSSRRHSVAAMPRTDAILRHSQSTLQMTRDLTGFASYPPSSPVLSPHYLTQQHNANFYNGNSVAGSGGRRSTVGVPLSYFMPSAAINHQPFFINQNNLSQMHVAQFNNNGQMQYNPTDPIYYSSSNNSHRPQYNHVEQTVEFDLAGYAGMWLYTVEFKAGRSEVFYEPRHVSHGSNTKGDLGSSHQFFAPGDWVIVEADRGEDLGRVSGKLSVARLKELLTETGSCDIKAFGVLDVPRCKAPGFVQTVLGEGIPFDTATGLGEPEMAGLMLSRELIPKALHRLATQHDLHLLQAKAQEEALAMVRCQSRIRQRKLPMDIVDAEYQWDRNKLTFYFAAEKRIDFRELVRDLFRIYKTRIWMCAVDKARLEAIALLGKGNTTASSNNGANLAELQNEGEEDPELINAALEGGALSEGEDNSPLTRALSSLTI